MAFTIILGKVWFPKSHPYVGQVDVYETTYSLPAFFVCEPGLFHDSHLILVPSLESMYCYRRFRDEQTESQRGKETCLGHIVLDKLGSKCRLD